MDDIAPKHFRFSLANLMLATVPMAIACLLSAPLVRLDFWPVAVPILVLGLSTGVGALYRGLAGLWPGLICGCVVVMFLLSTLGFIGLVHVLLHIFA